MGRISHREFQTRLAHLDELWNQPNRTDWYLMQIAREVAVKSTKTQGRPGVGKFKIPFKREDVKQVPTLTREQAAAYAKTQLGVIVGRNRKK